MVSPNSGSDMNTVVTTGDVRIDALLHGTKWGGEAGTAAALTYSFAGAGSTWAKDYGDGEPAWSGYGGLSASQQACFRDALAAWAGVANVTFTEVHETATNVGDIRAAFSSLPASTYAWSYFPADVPEGGDVWLNSGYSWPLADGSYAYMSLIHELGHALGLKHSFESGVTLPTDVDSTKYTVMSYTRYDGVDICPTTPMLYDILAIQDLYGANWSTRAGDTVYTFTPDHLTFSTIWDGGGIDRIDAAQQTEAVDIDLRAGQFSSIGVNSDGSRATDNLAIAFHVVIENASGGSGDDWIGGNEVSNTLAGGAGSDSLYGGNGADSLAGGAGDDSLAGGNGNDTLEGGTGIDTLVGGAGDDHFVVDNTGDLVIETAGNGLDWVESSASFVLSANVENLTLVGDAADGTGNTLANLIEGNALDNLLSGGAGADTVLGNDGADREVGGADGDKLYGGNGADWLAGGAGSDFLFGDDGDDTLWGSDGADRLVGGGGTDSLDAGSGDDSLAGGSGNDTLVGGAGNDTLDGGSGNDTLTGGSGADTFVFLALFDGKADIDTLVGYWAKAGDVIDLPAGAASVVSEALVNGVWQITLAGDHDIIRFENTPDLGTKGTILDDLVFT